MASVTAVNDLRPSLGGVDVRVAYVRELVRAEAGTIARPPQPGNSSVLTLRRLLFRTAASLDGCRLADVVVGDASGAVVLQLADGMSKPRQPLAACRRLGSRACHARVRTVAAAPEWIDRVASHRGRWLLLRNLAVVVHQGHLRLVAGRWTTLDAEDEVDASSAVNVGDDANVSLLLYTAATPAVTAMAGP